MAACVSRLICMISIIRVSYARTIQKYHTYESNYAHHYYLYHHAERVRPLPLAVRNSRSRSAGRRRKAQLESERVRSLFGAVVLVDDRRAFDVSQREANGCAVVGSTVTAGGATSQQQFTVISRH